MHGIVAKIPVNCDAENRLRRVPLEELKTFQGELKTLGQAEHNKLRDSMLANGFIAPVYIWTNGNRILDGHQRVKVLTDEKMEVDGGIPVVDIHAADEKDAAEKLLLISSAYGKVEPAGLFDFTSEYGVEIGADSLEDLPNFDKDEYLADFFDEYEGGKEGEEENAEDLFQIYPRDVIASHALKFYREAGFPYRDLKRHQSMQQINKLAIVDQETALHSVQAYHVADTYNRHRFHASANGKKSPYESFNLDKSLLRAINLELDGGGYVDTGLLGTMLLVLGTQACANFRPAFAMHYYRKYLPSSGGTVLDTSTGYGGRLVGAIASRRVDKYIGIDPNTETHQANIALAEDLDFSANVELINKPAEDVKEEIEDDSCDFSFTSPPYFAKEEYSEEDTQSYKRYKTPDEWRDGFLFPMLALTYRALKPGAFAAVVVADVKINATVVPLVEWVKSAAGSVGFTYVKSDAFDMSARYGANQEDGVATETAIIVRKNDVES